MIFFSRFWPYPAFSGFCPVAQRIRWTFQRTGKSLLAALHKLTSKGISAAGPGKYNDGGGLWLHKRETGAQWVLRFVIHGRRREMGLGGYPIVSLKEVRETAEKYRKVVREGKDPIKERDRERRDAARNIHLLKDIAADAFEVRKSELKGDGKAGQIPTPAREHSGHALAGSPRLLSITLVQAMPMRSSAPYAAPTRPSASTSQFLAVSVVQLLCLRPRRNTTVQLHAPKSDRDPIYIRATANGAERILPPAMPTPNIATTAAPSLPTASIPGG